MTRDEKGFQILKPGRALLSGVLFLACIVAANWATTHWGVVTLIGLTATAGTYLAGLALLVRDVAQREGGPLYVLILIALGAALSYLVADPRIAFASLCAFAISETADMIVYTPLAAKGWNRAVLASNAVGAFLDSWIFLSIAGFPHTWSAVSTQWVVKMGVTVITLLALGGARAVLRHSVQPTHP